MSTTLKLLMITATKSASSPHKVRREFFRLKAFLTPLENNKFIKNTFPIIVLNFVLGKFSVASGECSLAVNFKTIGKMNYKS